MAPGAGFQGRANYFFALLPSPLAAASADRMAHALRDWLDLSGPPRGPRKYHVTLWGWPEAREPDRTELALLRRVGQRIRQDAFRLDFDAVAVFARRAGKPALVMVGSDGVIGADRLHEAIEAELRASGFRSGRASFRPHLTLLYDHCLAQAFRVRRLGWRVTEFVLIRSIPRRDYEILGRWPLRGG